MEVAVFLVAVLLATQEVFSQPLPGGEPEGGLPPDLIGQEACIDLVFMFDVSCSVSEENQIKAIEFSKRLVNQLKIVQKTNTSSVKLSAAIFEKDVNTGFYLNQTNSEDDMLQLLDTLPALINATAIECDTMTHIAVRSLYEAYFTGASGDRVQRYRGKPVYPNVAIFFTDARTHPRAFAGDGRALDKALRKATAAEITNYVVLLDNNRTEEDANGNKVIKPPLDHLKLTGNEPNRVFDIRTGRDVDAEVTALAKALNDEYICVLDDPERPCVDITFAFDVSCSIDDDIKDLYGEVASKTYMELINNAGGDLLVSALVFDVTARAHFLFDTYGNQEVNITKVDNALQNVPVENVKCRTMPQKMFYQVKRRLGRDGDRPNVPNVLVLFYDGMTSPLRRRKHSIAEAKRLKERGVDIHLVRLENNRGKDGNKEFQEIASPDRLFPLESGDILTAENKDNVVEELFDKLLLYRCENQIQ